MKDALTKAITPKLSSGKNIILLLKQNPAVIAILVIALIPQFTWYNGADLVWGDDTNFPFDLGPIVQRLFHIWDSNYAMGRPDLLKLTQIMPLGVIYATWNFLGLPFSVIVFERIFIYVIFAGSGLSMFILLRSLIGKEHQLSCLAGAIFYSANPFLLILFTSPGYYLMELAFLPLVVHFFIRGLREEKGLRFAIGVAMVWTLTITPAYTAMTYVFTDVILLLLFFAYYISYEKSFKNLRKAIKFASLVFIAWIGLNSLWLIPNIAFNSHTLSKYLDTSNNYMALYEKNSIPPADSSRLLGYWGLESSYRGSLHYSWYPTFKELGFPILAFIIPIMAFTSLYFWTRSKYLLYFVIVALLAIFFVKGHNEPLGGVNDWIFSNPTIAVIFRSVQRLSQVIAFAYSIMIATTVVGFWNIIKQKGLKRTLSNASLLCVIVIVIAIIPWPLWTGAIQDGNNILPSRRAIIPAYFVDATSWLNQQHDDFNVLQLPFSKNGDDTFSWESGWWPSTSPYLLASQKPFLIGNTKAADMAQMIIEGKVHDSEILNALNIRYIVFTRDSNWNYIINNNGWVATQPEVIESKLSLINGLKKVKTVGMIDFYQNEKWTPRQVYAFNHPDDLSLYTKLFDLQIQENPKGNQVSPIYINITHSANMSDDFRDLRFTYYNQFGNEMPISHWIESYDKSKWAKVRLNIPSTEYKISQIEVYYGSNVTTIQFPNGVINMGKTAITNEDLSSSSLPQDGQYSIIGDNESYVIFSHTMKASGIYDGWFSFSKNTTRSWPIISIDDTNKWNYFVTADRNGHFAYNDGKTYHNLPIDTTYQPETWYNIKVKFDYGLQKYWIYIDNVPKTPEGLDIIHSQEMSGSSAKNWRVVLDGKAGSLIRLYDLKIYDDAQELTYSESPETRVTEVAVSLGDWSNTQYSLQADSTTQYYLFLTQTFDPGWAAYVDGVRLPDENHFPSRDNANEWRVNMPGYHKITLIYEQENLLEYGMAISSATFIISSLILLRPKINSQRVIRYLKPISRL